MTRLSEGCARLGIPMPDPEQLGAETRSLIHDADQAVVKILVTRGSGGRGYRPPQPAQPRRMISRHDMPEPPAGAPTKGITVRWCSTRLGINPTLAGLKHCNRLEQVLARGEWDDPLIPEGVMCDVEGRVIEGTQSNLFLYRAGTLLTPALRRCGVSGLARSIAISEAEAAGIPVEVCDILPDTVLAADGMFLTNALIGAWPVARLDGHRFDVSRLPADLLQRIVERCRAP